ncbi:unnamed protein product [Ostreobium quekettii]|uniref:Uncharacterized protein n=1 Tax=Ostreobium quekettii TaxID=121088 RepID=A0A8S1IMI7_9CHLO|nr:unnamed protein product [Ostreobium quekettii]|eukprot:evm.model.scf_112.5 EVM.evm.TU.scf_112.5   scf_112:38608-41846(+)
MSAAMKMSMPRADASTRISIGSVHSAHSHLRVSSKHSGRQAARCAVVAEASSELGALSGIEVVGLQSGALTDVTSLCKQTSGSPCIMVFFTHWGDLGSWEYAQRLVKVLPKLEDAGIEIVATGLGSVSGGREFSKCTGFPLDRLYADPAGECHRALGFNPGFARDADISPYIKLLTMLAGVGSPGTIQEVLRGYIGDRESKPVYDQASPFDLLGTGYQRPFELATLRLKNMVDILPKWEKLCPPDNNLLVQQGGTLVFKGDEVVFKHEDSGILKTADVEELLAAVAPAAADQQ